MPESNSNKPTPRLTKGVAKSLQQNRIAAYMLTCDFSHFMSGPNSFSQPNDQNGMPDCGELSQFVSSHYRAQIRHLNPLPKPAEYQEAITSSPQRRSRFFAVKVPPISNDGQQSLLETMATVAAFNRTTLNESQESANSVLASIPKSQQGCTQLQSKLQTSYKLATVCHTQQRHQFKRNLWSIIQVAEAIRLIRLDAPHSVEAGQPIRLRCLYETRGDKLQSLSWYRNGREFYRFQPFERRQPILAFNLTGIQIDVSDISYLNVYHRTIIRLVSSSLNDTNQ